MGPCHVTSVNVIKKAYSSDTERLNVFLSGVSNPKCSACAHSEKTVANGDEQLFVITFFCFVF